MKIGILTQPLKDNYGGILQNYALQTALRDMGHEPVTLRSDRYPLWRWPLSLGKTLLGRSGDFMTFPPLARAKERRRAGGMLAFIERHIRLGKSRSRYCRGDIGRYGLDALIVGSDQTWRPKYNASIPDMFLRFAAGAGVIRLAYAASFGTSVWELTPRQTALCRKLVKDFRAVSVREDSGVGLCRDHLGCDAEWVLDPTFLLTPDRYAALCADIPRESPYLFAYLLDITPEKRAYVESVAGKLGLGMRILEAGRAVCSDDSPERWLAAFRDAAFVITDSFHGTAFAVNFGRPFITFTNAHRGNARFDSLARDFGIGHRILSEVPSPGAAMPEDIDWQAVAARMAARREQSMRFLRTGLGTR